MTPLERLLPLIPIAYLMGSVPFGLWVGLARGVDPRKEGSGNIGATNVGRLLGGRFFALVFCLDLLKGLLPMLAAAYLLANHPRAQPTYFAWLMVGFAAILGHMFSAFLRFKGGKGVATTAGVMLGLFPYYTIPGLCAIGIFGAVFLLTRYVSAASMLGSVSFPFAYVMVAKLCNPPWPVLHEQLPLLVFACLLPVMIVSRHRGNIARLRSGTEHRAGTARKQN